MSGELVAAVQGSTRLLTYAGYVLLVGTLIFWTVVWPQGRAERRLVQLAATGTGLLVAGTIAGPLATRLVDQASGMPSPLVGASLLVRLAVLAGVAFFLADLVAQPVTGWRATACLGVVAMVTASLVTSSHALGGPWQAVTLIANSGHVLATGAWLGGLVVLAAVLLTREDLAELDRLIRRFSVVATASVATLLLTGILHAMVAAGGFGGLAGSPYGVVLAVKVLVVGMMLVVGQRGRLYSARVVFAHTHPAGNPLTKGAGVHRLAILLGVELALACAVLVITTVLVAVAP